MFCHCGCGQLAPLITKTNSRLGLVKGQPRRFIHNHHSKFNKRTDTKAHERTNASGYVWILMPTHPSANRDGYVLRSHVIAEEKIGRLLAKDEHVHHINRIRNDDRPANLMILTSSEHRALHHREDGTPKGERNGRSKLTDDDVRAIRRLLAEQRLSQAMIAAQFGVNQTLIGFIARGVNWAHVT